jgi:hypothetical protein
MSESTSGIVGELQHELTENVKHFVLATQLPLEGGVVFARDDEYTETAASLGMWSHPHLAPGDTARQKSIGDHRIHLRDTALARMLESYSTMAEPSSMHPGLHVAGLPVRGGSVLQVVSREPMDNKLILLEESYQPYAQAIAANSRRIKEEARHEISRSIGDGLMRGQPERPNGVYIGHDMSHSTRAVQKNEARVTDHMLRVVDAFDRVLGRDKSIASSGDGGLYFWEIPGDLNDQEEIRRFGQERVVPTIRDVVARIKGIDSKYRTRVAFDLGYYEPKRNGIGQRDIWSLDDILKSGLSRDKPLALGAGEKARELFGLGLQDVLDIERSASV